MQLRAEIEDSRDLVLSLCKEFLPESQWRLIAQDIQVSLFIYVDLLFPSDRLSNVARI